jgi:hypothetical protein
MEMNEKSLQDEGITSLRAQLPEIPPRSDNRLNTHLHKFDDSEI